MAESEKKKYITREELATHRKPGDLWISIDGNIYDVSKWALDHPGGELPLQSLAGQDATDAFLAYHPRSARLHLRRFSTGLLLKDYTVSATSKDYRRLLDHFTDIGLFEQRGHGVLVLLSLIAIMFMASVAGVVLCRSSGVHMASAALLGFMWIQSGWIGHDSGHYRVMTTKKLNRFAQILTGNCLAGISIGWWKWNHNAHHIAVNSLDYDPDLQHMPLFVVSSKFFSSITSRFYERKLNFDSVSRFFVSFQHWSFYPVMCLARLNLFGQSFSLLLSNRRVKNRGEEIFGLAVFWIWYPILVSQLPNWKERALYVLISFAVTGIQHVQFTLNHFSAKVYVGAPRGNDWFEKQTNGTLNIVCPPWMDWFHGGLQFQIEHHMFPRLPRCQLRHVSPFVKELCKKHDLPYNAASFFGANVMTLTTLRDAAMEARNLASPIPRNLLWEAVNAQG